MLYRVKRVFNFAIVTIPIIKFLIYASFWTLPLQSPLLVLQFPLLILIKLLFLLLKLLAALLPLPPLPVPLLSLIPLLLLSLFLLKLVSYLYKEFLRTVKFCIEASLTSCLVRSRNLILIFSVSCILKEKKRK